MWANDPGHPFAGIAEKLKRADQNIVNLHSEIMAFFQSCKYPVIPNTDDKEWQDAVNYHKVLLIPKRFSVLAGEIVHHFRSCLDHIVWIFSDDTAKRLHENALEFPIFRDPLTKDDLRRYERKIQGITNARVRALIKQFQPYQRGANAVNDPLCIVHDMDRFDKHRELVIVTSCANAIFSSMPADLMKVVAAYAKTKTVSLDDLRVFQRAVKQDADVTPQIAFAQFGNRKHGLVVPCLAQLLDAVGDVADLFAREL